jgi:methyl-accepting chemotaxis protein
MLAAVQVRSSPVHVSARDTDELQTMQENNESIEDIVKKVEDITESVAQLAIGPPFSTSPAATSSDIVSRTERFNRYVLFLLFLYVMMLTERIVT